MYVKVVSIDRTVRRHLVTDLIMLQLMIQGS
jgi:hypothetical protein